MMDFRAAIKKGKRLFDSEVVEEALLRRACGYGYIERIKALRGDELGLVKEVRKEMPPDTKAMIFWLSNRAPGRWRRNT
jgi:hypothetical protein